MEMEGVISKGDLLHNSHDTNITHQPSPKHDSAEVGVMMSFAFNMTRFGQLNQRRLCC